MKLFISQMQKGSYKMFLFIALIAVIFSCQEDKMIVENPEPEQAIQAGSDLFNAIQRIAQNNGSIDDAIDNTSCASIDFPFTVIYNEEAYEITNETDLQTLLALLANNQGGNTIEIVFPIVIVLSDYTTITIESQEALEAFIASCTAQEDDCVDFVFPISFSVFNIDFELIETVVINSNIELYLFLESISNTNTIVSLNFPVSLAYGNGTTIEVSTNEELAAAIADGPNNCEVIIDPENPCPATIVEMYLEECFWSPVLYNGDDVYEFYNFTFGPNNMLELQTPSAYEIDALWEVYENNGDTFLQLENNAPIFDPFEGEWKVLQCSPEEIMVEQNGVQVLFNRNCGPNLADCYGSGQGVCDDDNDGFVTVDIGLLINSANCNDSLEYVISFYETVQDAYNGTNMLPQMYTTVIPGLQTLFYAVRDINDNSLEYVGEYEIIAEDCGTGCDNPGVLTDDLIVYIPFGNEVRELISDEILNIGGGEFVEDRNGNPNCAVGFGQNDGPISIPGTAENEIQGDFTISLWFKMQNDDAGDLEIMFRTQQSTIDGLQLGVFDLNTPLFITYNPEINLWDNDWNQEVDVIWTNTDWHHLVITHEGSITKMYRDGILRNETSVDINLGGATDTGYFINDNFVGHLDDLRVYRRALNLNEIFTLNSLDGECYDCLD